MTTQNTFLKNILTTASALAIVTGVASEVSAGTPQNVAGPTNLSTIIAGNSANWAVFNSVNATLSFNATNQALAGVSVVAGSCTIYVKNIGASIGSIRNNSSTLALQVYDGTTLTLTGTSFNGGVGLANDYTGLGATTLGNSTGGAAGTTLNITTTGLVTFSNTFDSYTGTTANWGTLNISGANHTFNGVIGGTSKLGAINITDGSNITFSANVTATSVNLNNTAAAVTLAGGTMTSNIYTNGASGTTAVNVNGADVTLAGSIGTSAHPINALYFSTDNTITISGTQDIYAPIIPSVNGNGTLKLSGGTTTLHYPVGTFSSNTLLTALRSLNINDQTLVIDASANDQRIGGSMTTTTGGSGTLTTQGSNQVLLYNDMGNGTKIGTFNVNANTTLFSGTVNFAAINLASNKSLVIDATSGSRNITGTIDGASDNVGTLTLQGAGSAHNIDIQSNVGTTHPLSSISVNNASGSTITFHGNVRTNGDIDTSGAGSTVNFGGTVTSTTGNFLTSQSASSSVTGAVSVGGSVTLGANASFAGGITATKGIGLGANTLTAIGGTINGNITGTGTFTMGNNVMLSGNIGTSNTPLAAVNLGKGNYVLNISGGSSIYAPITTGYYGALIVTGGNVLVSGDIAELQLILFPILN